MPAIHPRVIAQSSFFSLLTCHSQSFKLTLQPFRFAIDERSTNVFVNTLRISFFGSLAVQLPSYPTGSLTASFSACCCLRPSFLSLSSTGTTSLFTLLVLHLSFFCLLSISNHTVSTRLLRCNTHFPPFQTHLFEMVCPSPFFFLLSVNFKPHSLHPSPPSPPSHCNTCFTPFPTCQFVMVDNNLLSLFCSSCLLKPHASCVPSTPSFPYSLSCLYSSSSACSPSLPVNAPRTLKQSPTLHPSFAWMAPPSPLLFTFPVVRVTHSCRMVQSLS